MTGPAETLRARDERVFTYRKPSTREYLRHASRTSGRSPLALVSEYLKLLYGPGRMTLPEYVQYGIHDPALGDGERRRFITNTLHWPIVHQCCDMTWQATTEDSWLCARILEGSGIPMPRTLAVVDRSARRWPGTRTVRTPAELRDVALAHVRDGDSIFGKENRGVSGFGTFLVREADTDRLHLEGEGWHSYEDCLDRLVGDTVYILQPVERNHAFFSRWTDRLATVRVCLLLPAGSGPKIPFTVLKVPGGGEYERPPLAEGEPCVRRRPADRRHPAGQHQGPVRHHRIHPASGHRRAAPRREGAPVGRRPRSCPHLLADVRARALPVDGRGDHPRRPGAHRDQHRRRVRPPAARERAGIPDRRRARLLPRVRRAASGRSMSMDETERLSAMRSTSVRAWRSMSMDETESLPGDILNEQDALAVDEHGRDGGAGGIEAMPPTHEPGVHLDPRPFRASALRPRRGTGPA